MLMICRWADKCTHIHCTGKKPHKKMVNCLNTCNTAELNGWGSENSCIPYNSQKENNEKENKENNMNEIQDGYKVVREMDDGKLKSASVGLKLVTYAIGENAKPRSFCGPLTVFSDKSYVNDFIDSLPKSNKYRVFKCTYVPTDIESVHRVTVAEGMKTKHIWRLPMGTVLAKSVYLTEEIFPSRF